MNEDINQKPLVHRADSLDVLKLTVRTHRALRRSGIGTVGKVLDAYREKYLMYVHNFGVKAYSEVESSLDSVTIVDGDVHEEENTSSSTKESKQVVVKEVSGFPEDQTIQILQSVLAGQIRVGLLHPNVVFNGEKLSAIARSTTYLGGLYFELTKILTGPLTVFDELEEILSGLSDRAIAILRLRYGFSAITLNELGERFGVSRERIRQIEQQASTQIRSKIESMPLLRIASALEFADDESMGLTYDRWARMITESGLRGDWLQEAPLEYDPLEMMIAICRATDWGDGRLICPDCLRYLLELRSQDKFNTHAKAMFLLQTVDNDLKRIIVRHLRHSGAVSLDWLLRQSITDCARGELMEVLSFMGFSLITENWYISAENVPNDLLKDSVLHRSLLKMFEYCGPLDISDIYFGIEHTLVKTEFPVPPISVLHDILLYYGYCLDDELWYWDGEIDESEIELNNGEQIILDTIRDCGGVAHHAQLSVSIQQSQFSFSILHGTLRRSPLFDNFAHGLYKLRGTNPSHQSVEDARASSDNVPVELTYDFDMNGRIVVEANLSAFALGGGTITSERLSSLEGEWHMATDASSSEISVTRNQIRGLRSAFAALECKAGDRVRLSFNVDTRHVTACLAGDCA